MADDSPEACIWTCPRDGRVKLRQCIGDQMRERDLPGSRPTCGPACVVGIQRAAMHGVVFPLTAAL